MNRRGAKPKAGLLKTLVVDDAEDDRYLLSALLIGKGHTVETAANGQEALVKLRSDSFDLVVSDILMPVMDGFRLCREVRKDGRLRRVLFVFYTATYIEKGDEALGLQLGADDFILKPAEPEALLARIQAVIDRANEKGWTPRSPELTEEADVSRLYSERLVAKLEKRTLEVERELAKRREAEEEVKASEERFRQLFDHMSSCVAVYQAQLDGEDFVIVDFNKAAEQAEAVGREEVVGKSVLTVFPGVKESGLFDVFQRVWRTGSPEHHPLAEYRDQRIRGWKENYVYRLPSGEVVTIYDDVTERKHAEDALRESESKYREVVENAGEAIFIAQDGYMRFANAATARLLDCTKEEVTSRPFPEFIHPKDQAMVISRHQRRLAGESVEAGYEFRFVTGRGGVRWGRLNAARVEWQGRPATLNFVSDVTERKEAEERLQRSQSATIRSMGALAETRDPYTAGHQGRVADLACAIASRAGLDRNRTDGLRVAALLHDIGKMSVPAEILSKPSKLTAIELSLVRGHPKTAFEILKGTEFPWPIAEIILQHHERLDGSGYPQGLKGEATLLEARILAVADVVEAMASHRPYRPALGIDAALEEIKGQQGKLYDSDVVQACVQLFADGFRFAPVGGHPTP